MKKFVLMTRGRTGPMPILDELAKCKTTCITQELFLLFTWTEQALLDLKSYYKLVPPFDLWRKSLPP